MLNKYKNAYISLKDSIFCNSNTIRYYRSKKITSADTYKNVYIHNGNCLVRRVIPCLFISRNIKFNVFFKKPLVRPQKKKKK